MSNEQENLAREWAERVKAEPMEIYSPVIYAAAEFILANTKPLTMADVEWDWEKHYLAGATNVIGDVECVMIAPVDGMIVNAEFGDGRLVRTSPGALTPNGKWYELREVGVGEPDVRRAQALVEELARDHNLYSLTDGKLARLMNEVLDALATTTPIQDVYAPDVTAHPETLVTEQDYENAPHGTIAAEYEGIPYIKLHSSAWWNTDGLSRSAEEMARIHRTVLRWGWGE